jgi:hypothetical protein
MTRNDGDDEQTETETEKLERSLLAMLLPLFGIDMEELPLTDPDRYDHAMKRWRNEPSTTSIKGEQMPWGLWCLRREGLDARLARAVRIDDVPAGIIAEAGAWTDDELRAWLARHETEARAKAELSES